MTENTTDEKDKNSDQEQQEDKESKAKSSTLSLGGKKTLSLKGGSAGGGQVTQSFSHGRTKQVALEVRKRRGGPLEGKGAETPESRQPAEKAPVHDEETEKLRGLSSEERESRARALREAIKSGEKQREDEARQRAQEGSESSGEEGSFVARAVQSAEQAANERELEALNRIEEEERARKAEEERRKETAAARAAAAPAAPARKEEDSRKTGKEEKSRRERAPRRNAGEEERRRGRLTVTDALTSEAQDDRPRGPSMAAQRRAREKAKQQAAEQSSQVKQVRDVTVPETITVQELANRMAERTADVVKELMKLGVMATATQSIDADTAELIVQEFGHRIKRVSDADVEEVLIGEDDPEDRKMPRPPVVTVMGHVDHGKTSLLDAMRETDVAAGESGGITQHIGAYQVQLEDGRRVSFVDTPGHAAFTAMRARGAQITDIVILVVAADDSLMPQTIEAINHAKAAEVPMIVAINKVDLPAANPQKIKEDLLQHEVIVEDMGGETLCVEISAKQRLNMDKLEEAILLQAELLDLRANPDREAQGRVVESKQERGRGSVATVLIQRGTLRTGDIFVTGAEWGRVRALVNDRGENVDEVTPGQPAEVLGLSGAPDSGDDFAVINDETRAKEISEYRQRKRREVESAQLAKARGSMEQRLVQARGGEQQKILPVIIKADVHGSIEAIAGAFNKISEDNPDVAVKVLHSAVGGITESDITLAYASNAMIIGFNVRASAQAREQANRDGVEIRYYSIIYNVLDDIKAMLGGLLSPHVREETLGYAQIREVFSVSKVGKVAGCYVTDGKVRRNTKVRLLRDDVVIFEGNLKTLKRFKDDVKEVTAGMECGMALENFDDIKAGDMIECFDVVEEQRALA